MKKNILIITALAVSVALASCGGAEQTAQTEETTENAPAETINWVVDAAQSNVRWEATTAGLTVYGHYGDIKINKGALTTAGETITAGSFVVDMNTIDPKDEGYSEESPASKLVAHLASQDFFAVEEYPMSMFEITAVEGNTIKGNLTVRGKTNEETIQISDIKMNEDGTMTAMGTLVFDRQKYDVAWAHFLEDTVLSDDITLEITLVATKA
jgi:polyisoprenoid-binding protein YceI